MKDKWLQILGWTAFALIAFAAVWMMSGEKFDHVRAIDGDGNYLIHETELIPKEDVDIFIAKDERLFVFFIDNELVNVYDDRGAFLYGIQFPDYANGKSDMTYQEGRLYVDARCSGIYVFDEKNLIHFEEQNAYHDSYDELEQFFRQEYPHRDGEYTYTYVAEENKFIRSANGEIRDFLQFPQRNENIIPLLVLDLGILAGLAYWDENKKNRK